MKTVIEMARESHGRTTGEWWDMDVAALKRFAELVRADERKPLTDEQISDMWCEVRDTDFVTGDTHVFARAIEAAHGIKEERHDL